ncbi:hypothetical protein KKG83_00885 [Candidatus Micrarchaeota archaeon]|nr:hypothetical protein [Candidatus Micrarchaeota archaeon]
MKKTPLKRSMLGLETEFFTLNENGFMASKADEIIKTAQKQKIPVIKECAKNMLELGVFPSTKIYNISKNYLEHLQELIDSAEKHSVMLYPLGTYPGSFEPEMRRTGLYAIKQKVFGESKFKIAGRNIGFHFHYTLPRGVFDQKKKCLKQPKKSKIAESMVNAFNLMLAVDPVLTTLLQSSPFYQGKYYGKDSRIIWYRGGKFLQNPDGLYSGMEEIGQLPSYAHTATDLINRTESSYKEWEKELIKAEIPKKRMKEYPSKLSVGWPPLKVNMHGTLEQRGIDMNHPKYVLGASVLISAVLREIFEEFLEIKPSDLGMHEPFKKENSTVHVPPDTIVREKLQFLSAKEGLDSIVIKKHIKGFVKLSRHFMLKEEKKAVKPLMNIIERNATVSDIWIKRVKKAGFSLKEIVPNDLFAEMALKSCRQLKKSMDKTKKTFEAII